MARAIAQRKLSTRMGPSRAKLGGDDGGANGDGAVGDTKLGGLLQGTELLEAGGCLGFFLPRDVDADCVFVDFGLEALWAGKLTDLRDHNESGLNPLTIGMVGLASVTKEPKGSVASLPNQKGSIALDDRGVEETDLDDGRGKFLDGLKGKLLTYPTRRYDNVIKVPYH